MSKAIEKPDETLSTVQPFEFSKKFTKQLKESRFVRNNRSHKRAGLCCDGCWRL